MQKLRKFGGRWRTSAVVAVPPPFFLKLCKICVKIGLFSFLTYVLRLKPSLIITDYMKVAKLPPPLLKDISLVWTDGPTLTIEKLRY